MGGGTELLLLLEMSRGPGTLGAGNLQESGTAETTVLSQVFKIFERLMLLAEQRNTMGAGGLAVRHSS